MTIAKSYVKAVITAIVVIGSATTIAFPNATVHATPAATTTTETTGQQQTVHITKHGTNSYLLSGGSSSVGSFDTTYRIAGERSAVRTSESLIISTITEDFRNSPTIGYVRAGTTTGAAQDATLPNPFATPEQITERITSELRRVIGEAENNTPQGQLVEIKCDFGMVLDDMRCHYVPSVGAGAVGGSEAATNTTDTTAPIAPLEGQ